MKPGISFIKKQGKDEKTGEERPFGFLEKTIDCIDEIVGKMRKLVLCLTAFFFAASLFFAFVAGCKSVYPPCDQAMAGEYRCAKTAIEMCDGEVWHPQFDCAEVSFPGENDGLVCAEIDNGAECVER